MKQKKHNYPYLVLLFISIILILNLLTFKPHFILFGLLNLELSAIFINLILIFLIITSMYLFIIKNKKHILTSKIVFIFLFLNSFVNIIFSLFIPQELELFLFELFQIENILNIFLINQFLILIISIIVLSYILFKKFD
jgi:hypothetical protein